MRTTLTDAPFRDTSKFWGQRGAWPAQWITHPQAGITAPLVQAFRRRFEVASPTTVRLHVTADERYDLFLDGKRIGRGSERGDSFNWFFETYDVELSPGQHTLVARNWWLGPFGPAPFAQASVFPSFLLAAEGESAATLHTGAAWEAKLLGGYRHVHPGSLWGTGSKLHLVGREFDWGFEHGGGEGWTPVVVRGIGRDESFPADHQPTPALTPGKLPPMIERPIHVGRARHVQALSQWPTDPLVVRSAEHLSSEAADWDRLLAGQGPLTLAPRTVRRVIIDLENYYCAYTDLITTGGAGATVRSWWAEALIVADQPPEFQRKVAKLKGNRDQIDGCVFAGNGDTFEIEGGPSRHYETLWWEAGRYVELLIATADQPLTIESFSLRETHYPNDWAGRFDASDPRLADVTPIAQRVMDMCMHETYMDCPYYEQLMYVGDTRLEALVTYTWTPDDRLPRKAIHLFDESRQPPGFTQSRYPSPRHPQIIPPFSAWWIAMVHDYAMWRSDRAFVVDRLPGVRAVLDTFMKYRTADGTIGRPIGWNYMDWVPGWRGGMPSGGDEGPSALLNFQLAWVLKQAAELEEYAGEPELAALQRRRSADLAAAAVARFWNESRGLLADDPAHQHFSEHAQCLAILGDSLDEPHRQRAIDSLFSAGDLAQTTVYFSHYLFETARVTGRIQRFFDRLPLWFALRSQGFKTVMEAPEPSRSDCHAWGAHPIFHYLASILGIRPASPGFSAVRIEPQLGPLQWARGSMVHPRGLISVDVARRDGRLSGRVTLPDGLTGTLIANGQAITLSARATVIDAG